MRSRAVARAGDQVIREAPAGGALTPAAFCWRRCELVPQQHEPGFIFGHPMADCRLVPVLLHHTLAASTADGRAPPCLSPAALIAVTARCCECVRPPQEPTATTGTSVVTETGGVTVLPDWGGTKVLPDYMDVRGILDIFAKARALHLCGPPAEWQTGADARAGAGAEVSLVLFPLLEVLELEDCAISRLTALPSSLRHLQATATDQPEPEPEPEPQP